VISAMRILIISPSQIPGTTGDVIRVQELSKALVQLGHKIFVVCSNYEERNRGMSHFPKRSDPFIDRPDNKIDISFDRINLYFIKKLMVGKSLLWKLIWFSFFNLLSLQKVIRICLRNRPHAIISYTPYTAIPAYITSRFFRKPWIYDARGIIRVEFYETERVKPNRVSAYLVGFMESHVLRKVSTIIVVSEKMKKVLLEMYSLDQKRIVVGEDGVDPDAFNLSLGRNAVRRKFSIEKSEKVILFLGTLSIREGVDRLIRAMPHVIKVRNDVKLLIVGGGSLLVNFSSEFKDLVRKLSIEKYVIFTGKVPHSEVPQYIADSDICVAPHISTAFTPLKVFEYLACGKPLIVTGPNTDIGEILARHRAGLAVNTEKPLELAKSILFLLNHPETSEKLGKNGYKLVIENFTWKHSAKKIETLISELLHKDSG